MAQRYQREIEEILDKVNEDAPKGSGGPKRGRGSKGEVKPPGPKPQHPSFLSSLFSFFGSLRYSPGRVALLGIALLVIALVSNVAVPAATAPLVWASMALFVVAYVLFFTKPRRPVERRWRGRTIDDGPGEESPLQRFWRWLSRG